MAKQEEGLNESQRKFCQEYIFDWNGTRAYKVAYPSIQSENAAAVNATKLLRNAKVQDYIKEIQQDLEKQAGISRLKVLREHEKLAFSSIAHLHNTWIERKAFDQLTDDQKDCIAEIQTQIRKKTETEYSVEEEGFISVPIEVEFVKIKLYDKQKSLDAISKMLGYNEPEKIEHLGDGLVPLTVTKASDGNK